tara:strand:+ start:326 stop:1018 length:693 start_codon:yes stop_codon:yes gene_type:complete
MNKDRSWYNKNLEYNGQAHADAFVLNCTNFKTNGYFLELGSRHPKENNNSYILEKSFGWRGVMVDRETTHEQEYKTERPNSIAIIQDATEIDYKKIFKDNHYPYNLDFFQLDLEVRDNTALQTLKKINEELFDEYKFATITMEHDIYTGIENAVETRYISREILKERGYYLVFKDILDPPEIITSSPYEDWWVHPELVDMNYVKKLQEKNKHEYCIEKKVLSFKSYNIKY